MADEEKRVGLLSICRFSIVFALHEAIRSSADHHLHRLDPGASGLICQACWR